MLVELIVAITIYHNGVKYNYIEKDYNIAPSLLNQAIKLRQHANGKRKSNGGNFITSFLYLHLREAKIR